MAAEAPEAFGVRVRRQRLRLGLGQAELAHRLGKKQGWVSKVENGIITPDRVGQINEIAAALHCHPNDLIGRPYPTSPAENGWHERAQAAISELRRFDLPPSFEGSPRPVAALQAELAAIHASRDSAAYRQIIAAVPGLLAESRALIESAGEDSDRSEAYVVYGITCKAAHTSGYGLGHPELIAMATAGADWAARNCDDPMMPAIARHLRARDMWATNSLSDAMTLLDSALGLIGDEYADGSAHALRTWGSLQLRAAVTASRQNRPGEVEDRIAYATEAAERLRVAKPERDRHELTFSPGNVLVHAVSAAVEMGDASRALSINDAAIASGQRDLADLPPSRISHHHLDIARAWLWHGDRHRSLYELETAEKIAPQLIRSHPIAHALVSRLIEAERAGTGERLRRIANRLGVQRSGH
jgi:transcriptional regulator with XRE-family HTH domain